MRLDRSGFLEMDIWLLFLPGSENDTITTEWSPNFIPDELADLRINDLLKVNEDLYLLATSQGVYKMEVSGSEIANRTSNLTLFFPESALPVSFEKQRFNLDRNSGRIKQDCNGWRKTPLPERLSS